MIDKSFISVANHQYDDPLSYESSRSSELYSDEPDDEHRIKPLPTPAHVKMQRSKNKQNDDNTSDSKNSDDQFLECESDYETPNRYNNPFVDYDSLVDIFMETRKLKGRRSKLFGKNDNSKSNSDNVQNKDLVSLESPRSDGKGQHASSKNGDGNRSHSKSTSNSPLNHKKEASPSKFTKDLMSMAAERVDRNNSNFSDQLYGVQMSDIGSDVNSELESRIIEYHESQKSDPGFKYDDDEVNSDGVPTHYSKAEDEIDELFDRVINGGYDPEFTFMPVPLDPYVKISDRILNKRYNSFAPIFPNKESSNSDLSGKNKDSDPPESNETKEAVSNSNSASNSASRNSTPRNTNKKSSHEQDDADSSGEGEGTKVDPSLVQTIAPTDHSAERSHKSEDRFKLSDLVNQAPKLERTRRSKDSDDSPNLKIADSSKPLRPILRQKSRERLEDLDRTDSDVEKEKQRVRLLFEATKSDESPYRRQPDEDVSKGLKVLKLREEKKSKKSKHHKAETESEDDKHKKDRKSEEKSSKSSSSKSEKSEKSPKDKKSDKSKKMSWKSNDYDIIFSSLGDAFSSGVIEIDSKPILLTKRGFYTIFFRNSKYPYDSTIDFYLFRIGFKYMLVNETSNQNFVIDDVVDYGNFRLKLSGNINLSPNVTKMALIYSNSDRQTLEFALTPSAFDSKPKIMYKLFYSGALQTVPMPLKFRRRLRVLSLDNSENLGTSVIGALYLLEKKLSELKKRKINLADYFDYICGTGAGALIALCMIKGYSMKDLRSQWNLIVSSLFKWTHSLPSGIIFDYYYIEEFKKNFINILGTDFICSKPWPHCMVTCTNVRSNPYELFLFRNYGDSKFGSLYGSSYAPMWLVGWAACALPTYVRGPSNSHLNSFGYNMINKTQFVDGSLVSSSPSLISLQELTSIYNINLRSLVKDNMDLFLSIGTSKSENDNASINSSTWQILMNCKNLMYNTQLQHLHVKNLFDEYENKYHRIQLPIYPGCKHGKTSKEAVDAVLTSTIQFISRHDNQRIEKIVNILNQ